MQLLYVSAITISLLFVVLTTVFFIYQTRTTTTIGIGGVPPPPMIGSVAMVIPIYPPHYSYIYTLLDKLERHKIAITIFCVFSNSADYQLFSSKKRSAIQPIIVTADNTSTVPIDGGIVTFKKFYALRQLIESTSYDYFIVCDAEIDIIPANFTESNIVSKIERIFQDKRIYTGSEVLNPVTRRIIRTSASVFNDEFDFETLRLKTEDFTTYFWWSDLPVYDRRHLPLFFSSVNAATLFNFYHFDYMIYQYFLVINYQFEFIDTSPVTGINDSIEKLWTRDQTVLQNLGGMNYGFSWITYRLYNMHRQFFDDRGTFLLYHLDR